MEVDAGESDDSERRTPMRLELLRRTGPPFGPTSTNRLTRSPRCGAVLGRGQSASNPGRMVRSGPRQFASVVPSAADMVRGQRPRQRRPWALLRDGASATLDTSARPSQAAAMKGRHRSRRVAAAV